MSAQYQGSMIEVIKHENTRMLREARRGEARDKKVSDIRPTEREESGPRSDQQHPGAPAVRL